MGNQEFFKYDHSDLCTDNKISYVDVALATAAPTYFPVHKIDQMFGKQYIDGGVWANNPTLCGLLEALKYFVNRDSEEYDRIEILSVSSLNQSGSLPIGSKCEKSFWYWKDSLLDTFMTGQSFFTNHFMTKISKSFPIPITYVRVPGIEIGNNISRLIQMDIATNEAINQMKSMADDISNTWEKEEKVAHFFKEQKNFKK